MDTTEWAQTHAHESILNPCEINWNVFRIILSVIYISQITNLQAFSNYNYPLLLYFPAYRCSQMGSRHNILNWIFQKTLSNVNPAIRLLYFMVMCNFCWNTVHHCLKAKPPSRQWYFESSLTLNLGQVVTSDLMFPVQLFPAGAGSDLLLKNVIWKLNSVPKLLFQPGCPLCIFLGDFRKTNPTTFFPEYVWWVTESFVPYFFNYEAMRCDEMLSC